MRVSNGRFICLAAAWILILGLLPATGAVASNDHASQWQVYVIPDAGDGDDIGDIGGGDGSGHGPAHGEYDYEFTDVDDVGGVIGTEVGGSDGSDQQLRAGTLGDWRLLVYQLIARR